MEIVFLERDSVGQDVDVSGFSELGHVTFYAMTRGEEEVRQRVRDAEVIIVNKAPMNERTLADAHALRMIAVLATGYNNCNVAYCKSRGIRVCNAVNYATAIVAQHTMTMALCLSQHILTYNAYVHSGAYARSGQFTCFTPAGRKDMGHCRHGTHRKPCGTAGFSIRMPGHLALADRKKHDGKLCAGFQGTAARGKRYSVSPLPAE